jgi:RHS repeat-associated protein
MLGSGFSSGDYVVSQETNYYPFGMPYPEGFYGDSYNPQAQPYKFGGKELDEMHGLKWQDQGARPFGAVIPVTPTPDPLQEKYYSVSQYSQMGNNPVNVIDPDGREGIVVSGSPGEHDNKLHFLINGLDRAQAAQRRAKEGEGTTWLIYNDKENGFNQKDLDKYTADAQKTGINVQVVSEVNDIVDYVNDKTGGDSRNNDQVSSFYYVGHSTPGDLDVGYAGSGQKFDPSDFKSSAFKSGAWVNVVGGCRTAIDDKFWGITIEKSVIRQFADILDNKSTINGSNVRVVYQGGKASDLKLLEPNKGKIITIHGNRK